MAATPTRQGTPLPLSATQAEKRSPWLPRQGPKAFQGRWQSVSGRCYDVAQGAGFQCARNPPPPVAPVWNPAGASPAPCACSRTESPAQVRCLGDPPTPAGIGGVASDARTHYLHSRTQQPPAYLPYKNPRLTKRLRTPHIADLQLVPLCVRCRAYLHPLQICHFASSPDTIHPLRTPEVLNPKDVSPTEHLGRPGHDIYGIGGRIRAAIMAESDNLRSAIGL